MPETLISSTKPVIFLGSGHFSAENLTAALTITSDVVAADGGANVALANGIIPLATIGDLDSIEQEVLSKLSPDHVFKVSEQDSTDFEKCLLRVSAPLVIGVGFTGARLDHSLAAFSSLAKFSHRPCILLDEEDLVFHAPEHLVLDLPPNTRFSIFPLSMVTGTSKGLRWPIDGLALSPLDRIGTSNQTTDTKVELRFDTPGALVLVPKVFLTQVVQRLLC